MTLPRSMPSRPRASRLSLVAALCLLALHAPAFSAPAPLSDKEAVGVPFLPLSELVVPPEPAARPVVRRLSEMDRDDDHLDDVLNADFLGAYLALSDPKAPADEKTAYQAMLDAPIAVEFNFTRQITQKELDAFTALGGQVTHIYKAVGYGWNGVIPRARLQDAVAAMEPGFNAVVANRTGHAAMYDATRNAGVRRTWSSGFKGDPNTTIAIFDTGVDGSHTDLAGRQAYWKDYIYNNGTSRDLYGHGTSVAGVALGSGAVAGVNPPALLYTDAHLFQSTIGGTGGFYGATVNVPPPSGSGKPAIQWSASAKWGILPYGADQSGHDAGLTFCDYENEDDPSTSVNDINYYTLTAETWDSTGAFSVNGRADGWAVPQVYTTSGGAHINSSLFFNRMRLRSNDNSFSNAAQYTVATTLTAMNGNTFSVGDNQPLLSGVAPNCRWAGFEIGSRYGDSDSDVFSQALDDMAALAVGNNIQIANASYGFGTDSGIRDKVNAAVNAGVFFTASAGNDGPGGATGDPAEAGKAMTVGASNSLNQLTSYTTNGFTGGTDAGSDAIKPDIIAPGGSLNGGFILTADSNNSDTYYANDQRPNDYAAVYGTSFAAPMVAGSAALVIQAWEQAGHSWRFGSDHDPLFVKMLLCATATETGQPREVDHTTGATSPQNSPAYGGPNSPKDGQEGYGLLNTDAAIECITKTLTAGAPESAAFGSGPFDKRATGCHLYLKAGAAITLSLFNPSNTVSTVICVYRAAPDTNGNPVLAAASPTQAGTNILSYTPSATDVYYVVVKRVSGDGVVTVAVSNNTFTPPAITTGYATNVNATSAGISGTVNPNGGTVDAYFEYGPTTSYGKQGRTFQATGSTPQYVSDFLVNLPVAATIHYHLVAVAGNARFDGPDQYLATWTPVAGDALQFDGQSDFVTLPNESAFAFGNGSSFSIEAWFKVDAWDKPWQAIVTKGDSAWRIHRYNATNVLSFGTTGLADAPDLTGVTNVADGRWHHVAATYTPNTRSLYLDGNLENNDYAGGALGQNNAPVMVGENAEQTGRFFHGRIDEVRLWNVYRAQSDIQANMHKTLNGNEAGLAAYLRFDDGSGIGAGDTGGHIASSPLTGPPVWVPSTAPIAPVFTVADAMTALKAAGGLAAPSAIQQYTLDVERDGVVNIADALRIARKASGLDTNP